MAVPFIFFITEGFSFPKLTKSLLSLWQDFIFLSCFVPTGSYFPSWQILNLYLSPSLLQPLTIFFHMFIIFFHPQAVNNFEGDQAAAWESAGWQQPGAGGVPGLAHNCCWRILESTKKKIKPKTVLSQQCQSQTCQNYQLLMVKKKTKLKNNEFKKKSQVLCIYLLGLVF